MTTMKILGIACLLAASSAFAQPVPTPEANEADGGARAVHEQFEQAWNRHDTEALSGMWTENGDYTEPDGRTVFGPKEVKRLFDIEHASVFKDSELHLVVERVRTPTGDVAIVDGTYELFNARDPAGKEIGTRTGYFTNVLVNEGGTWKVSAARLMLPVTLIWRAQ